MLGHVGVASGWLCRGIRVPRRGRRAPAAGRAAVYCSNHQSNVDPPILFAALHPRMHILYKREIDRIPILARAFRMGGFIPVDRTEEGIGDAVDRGRRASRSGAATRF